MPMKPSFAVAAQPRRRRRPARARGGARLPAGAARGGAQPEDPARRARLHRLLDVRHAARGADAHRPLARRPAPDGQPALSTSIRCCGKDMARAIADGLGAQLPGARGDLQEEPRRATCAKLDAAIARWEKEAAPLKGKKLVSYHPDMIYFAERFGMEPVGHDRDPRRRRSDAGAHRRARGADARARRSTSSCASCTIRPGLAETVAQATGAKLVELPVDGRRRAARRRTTSASSTTICARCSRPCKEGHERGARRRCDDVSLGYDGAPGPRARLARRSSAASSSPCSGRTAPARRRCCAACSGSIPVLAGRIEYGFDRAREPAGLRAAARHARSDLSADRASRSCSWAPTRSCRRCGRSGAAARASRRECLEQVGLATLARAAVLGALGRAEAARADRARARRRAGDPAPRRADGGRRPRGRGGDHRAASPGSTASAASPSSWSATTSGASARRCARSSGSTTGGASKRPRRGRARAATQRGVSGAPAERRMSTLARDPEPELPAARRARRQRAGRARLSARRRLLRPAAHDLPRRRAAAGLGRRHRLRVPRLPASLVGPHEHGDASASACSRSSARSSSRSPAIARPRRASSGAAARRSRRASASTYAVAAAATILFLAEDPHGEAQMVNLLKGDILATTGDEPRAGWRCVFGAVVAGAVRLPQGVAAGLVRPRPGGRLRQARRRSGTSSSTC